MSAIKSSRLPLLSILYLTLLLSLSTLAPTVVAQVDSASEVESRKNRPSDTIEDLIRFDYQFF